MHRHDIGDHKVFDWLFGSRNGLVTHADQPDFILGSSKHKVYTGKESVGDCRFPFRDLVRRRECICD